MYKMKHPLSISLLAIILALILLSCDQDDDLTPSPNTITTAAELRAALQDIYVESEAPALAVSVLKEDAVIFQESFGKADIEAQIAYTNQTIQPIGSISKTFVAAAIVHAIEQGHFTLDTDINDILPVAVTNPKQPNAVIRVKHLVTHSSGLLDEMEAYFQGYHILPGEELSTAGAQLLLNGFGIQQREPMPLDEYLAAYYLEGGDWYSTNNFAAAVPGTSWNYSNIATSLAAYLIEAATGSSFETYVETHILQPLGMGNTTYDRAKPDATRMAKLYWDKNTPLPNYGNDSYPDGSINTSNEDLAIYLKDMMKGARGQSNTLFSRQGYQMLFQAMLPNGKTPAAYADNQGIFWFLGGNKIKHDGSDPGTTCDLQFDSDGQFGYFLMTNMDALTDEHEAAYRALSSQVHAAITEFIQHN